MPETITLFFNENENILEYFHTKGIVLSDIARNNIKEIGKKANNNLIGYYQFKEKKYYYKIYVLPKIYKKSDDETNKKYFFSFIKNYYKLKKDYTQLTPKIINSNIVDMALDSNSPLEHVNNIDKLIELKYLDALRTIKKFFKKHNKNKSKLVSYTSQSVKYKINLGKNIKEPDKSKIHQDKHISVLYSKLAFITINSLEYFLKHRVPSITSENKETKKLANQTKNIILKKFITDKSFSFKTKDITKDKINRLFKKNNEYRKLYNALLILLGAEYYSTGTNNKEVRKVNHMTALYLAPDLLYEWYVYQQIKTVGNPFIDIDNYTTKFDKIDSETSLSYSITNDNDYNSRRKSNPDYILENDCIKVIIDAKWKIFDNDSEKSNGLKIEDVIKLQRDVEIRKDPNCEKNIQAILIYPKVLDSYKNRIFKMQYPFNNNIFNFKVIEVPYL